MQIDLQESNYEDLDIQISSPNYPNFYSNFQIVEWRIIAKENENVEFNLMNIDIEFLEDYLEIFGDENLENKLAHITGCFEIF